MNVTGGQTTARRVTFNRQQQETTLTKGEKGVFVLENPAQPGISVCPSLSNELTGHQTQKKKKKSRSDTFHQQPSIYTLRLLACHSISHSVDYTPRGARGGENHTGNPILCHIKCQGRSFRFSVITTETAGRRWRRGEDEG